MGVFDGFRSLASGLNKVSGTSQKETVDGLVSPKLPELRLDMEDEEIVRLTTDWEKEWDTSEAKRTWSEQCEENEKYWLGKHWTGPVGKDERPVADNVLFEAVETFLPQVTRRNPEPVVTVAAGEERSEEDIAFAKLVQDNLADLADVIKMRLKLKRAARHWATYLIAVGKYSWNGETDAPDMDIVRPQKIILNPNSTINERGYSGGRVGEHREMQASKMAKLLDGEKAAMLEELVDGNMGSTVGFTEWWTEEYLCWVMRGKVLLKVQNPHWNYGPTEENPSASAFNHFRARRTPYSFLTVFGLDKKPMDETSLFSQNLSNQDTLNKRTKQKDANIDRMNGGMVVSLARSGLTKSEAQKVTRTLRNGGAVLIPDGAPRDAIDSYNPVGLPADVYNDTTDLRQRIRDIFGTTGSTPAGVSGETTVRGKVIVRGMDADRNGGGISEYIEQFADDAFNWFLQLAYVYDDNVAGWVAAGKTIPRVIVSVKEGSLLPKDTLTLANQAIELASAGKMSTLDLYKRLDFPNPEEMAANVWLEANAPEVLYKNVPAVAEVMAARMAPQPAAPAPAPAAPVPDQAPPPSTGPPMMPEVGPSPMAEVPLPNAP